MLYRYLKVGGAVLHVTIRKWVGLVTKCVLNVTIRKWVGLVTKCVLNAIIRKWVGLVTVWAVQVIFEGGWDWALAANLCSAHIFVAP